MVDNNERGTLILNSNFQSVFQNAYRWKTQLGYLGDRDLIKDFKARSEEKEKNSWGFRNLRQRETMVSVINTRVMYMHIVRVIHDYRL